MSFNIPAGDGELNVYNLTQSVAFVPKIYYVNGIRVLGRDHAITASLLSLLTERPIHGIYNRTTGSISGLVFDLAQSGMDYLQNAGARAGSKALTPNRNYSDQEIETVIRDVFRKSIVWNQATATLFRSLVRGRNSPQMVIAHSQGNLITSNALFLMERILGSGSLSNVRVYSLASPSPGWPLGLRHTNGGGGRQENAFMNDMVALLRPHNLAAKVGVTKFQNEGDFRTHRGSGAVSLAPHDTNLNIALNFLKSIRRDLGLSTTFSDDFLEKSAALAEKNIPIEKRSFWQKLDDLF